MIHRASIADVKNGKVTRADGLLVVTMRLYPRFLPKALVDEYVSVLSPHAELFQKYREFKKQSGDQNGSFQRARYEQEFALEEEGMSELARIVGISKERSVYLICQCEKNECCHVDLMMIIAETQMCAEIGKLPHRYSLFRQRI